MTPAVWLVPILFAMFKDACLWVVDVKDHSMSQNWQIGPPTAGKHHIPIPMLGKAEIMSYIYLVFIIHG